MTARILIVEDDHLYQDYLRIVCADVLGMNVVGLARDRDTAIRLLREQRPDLALLDLRLEADGGTGLEIANWARTAMPRLRILIISGCCSLETIRKVEQLRVCGFLDKSSLTIEQLMAAIRAVAAGQTYFSASYQRSQERRKRDPKAYDWLLSDKERAVLRHIADALNDDEIAALLGLSVRTVETHRHRLLRKLGLDSTPKLMKFAIDQGFTEIDGAADLPAPNCVA